MRFIRAKMDKKFNIFELKENGIMVFRDKNYSASKTPRQIAKKVGISLKGANRLIDIAFSVIGHWTKTFELKESKKIFIKRIIKEEYVKVLKEFINFDVKIMAQLTRQDRSLFNAVKSLKKAGMATNNSLKIAFTSLVAVNQERRGAYDRLLKRRK